VFTREEVLALWDDLNTDNDAYLYAHGEVTLTRHRTALGSHAVTAEGYRDDKSFGYFLRARNNVFTPEMLAAFNRICLKHGCTYRVEMEGDQYRPAGILFYKPVPPYRIKSMSSEPSNE
jgi:hypothetical protein